MAGCTGHMLVSGYKQWLEALRSGRVSLCTSGPSNVGAMGPLPIVVLWRGQAPLQHGEHCGFWRQKNRKNKTNQTHSGGRPT